MSFPYMPLYVGDYLRDTNNLNAEEHGAYLLLIFDLWNAGGRLPADPEDLRIRARVSRRRWPAVWYKLAPKFIASEGYIEHRRVSAELSKARTKSEVAKLAGRQSARVKSLKNKKTGPTDVQRTFNQSEPEPVIEPIEGSITGETSQNVVQLAPARDEIARGLRLRESLKRLREELDVLDRIEAKRPEARSPERRQRITDEIAKLEGKGQ